MRTIYTFGSHYQNSFSHLQPSALGLFFLSSPYVRNCPFPLAPTWWLPAGGGHIVPSPCTFPDQSPQLWCFGAPFQAQVTQDSECRWLKKKLVLIEPEHQEPGTTMTVQIFLFPCSPNFCQHFSQANCNLLLLLLFPSLEFMHEEIIWMTVHSSTLGTCPLQEIWVTLPPLAYLSLSEEEQPLIFFAKKVEVSWAPHDSVPSQAWQLTTITNLATTERGR